MPLIVAGTNMKLRSRDIFNSIVAKSAEERGQTLKVHIDFTCTSAEECARFIEHLLRKSNITFVSKEDISLAGYWLQGMK
jgi:hypothetical protein